MVIEYAKYCYKVILTQFEEDMQLNNIPADSFMYGYEKRDTGVYYPSILGTNQIFNKINNSYYTLKNLIYGNLIAKATADGDSIFKLNNWMITYSNELIEKPTNIEPYVWQCSLRNPYPVAHWRNNIAKEGDILVFKRSNGKTVNYTLTDYFKYDLNINTGEMTFLNHGGGGLISQ